MNKSNSESQNPKEEWNKLIEELIDTKHEFNCSRGQLEGYTAFLLNQADVNITKAGSKEYQSSKGKIESNTLECEKGGKHFYITIYYSNSSYQQYATLTDSNDQTLICHDVFDLAGKISYYK